MVGMWIVEKVPLKALLSLWMENRVLSYGMCVYMLLVLTSSTVGYVLCNIVVSHKWNTTYMCSSSRVCTV